MVGEAPKDEGPGKGPVCKHANSQTGGGQRGKGREGKGRGVCRLHASHAEKARIELSCRICT